MRAASKAALVSRIPLNDSRRYDRTDQEIPLTKWTRHEPRRGHSRSDTTPPAIHHGAPEEAALATRPATQPMPTMMAVHGSGRYRDGEIPETQDWPARSPANSMLSVRSG